MVEVEEILRGPYPVYPPDLKFLQGMLAVVPRYQVEGYPEGVFTVDKENVDRHTRRLIEIWDLTRWPEGIDILWGRRMLWVHDAGEGKSGDTSVVEAMVNKGKAERVKRAETAAIQNMLSDTDFRLYKRFERAKAYWKGNENHGGDLTAMAAALVDIICGNLIFHKFMSEHYKITKDQELTEALVQAFNYQFDEGKVLIQQVMKIQDLKVRECFMEMIREQFEKTEAFWDNVPKYRIPAVLKLRLEDVAEWRWE